MAITTTRINGTTQSQYYSFYANVTIDDTIRRYNNQDTFLVIVNSYLVNNNGHFGTSGWKKEVRIDYVEERVYTNQTIDTTGVSRYGGEVNVISEMFYVPITLSQIYVVSYLEKSSYASYEPGYCLLAGFVSMPKVMSMWSSSLLSIPDITGVFQLPITKYVAEYYDVVEVRNQNNQTLVKTINDARSNTNYSFTSGELNTIYTMDNNKNQQNQRFYMDLKTYTNSSKTTQIGTTQRLTCDGYLVGSNPTASVTITEQDPSVISLLGGDDTKIIKNASDLLFTITATAKNGADISSVKVNDKPAVLVSTNYVINITDITTGTFNIVVTDSRNNSTTITETKTMLDYLALKINSLTIPRASQTSSDLVLSADITCYSGTVNGSTNTPTVQYSIDNENWITIPSTDYTFTSNKITISSLTLSNVISYQTPGVFYLKITDLLGTIQDNKNVSVGIYTFAKSDRKVRINGTLEIADSGGNNRINVMDKINGDVLSSTSTTGTVTLSKSAANYNYIEIFYSKGSYFNSVKVFNPNNKIANLIVGYVDSTSFSQLQMAVVTISGTSITKTKTGLINFNGSNTYDIYTSNEIYIDKVVGYK